jgi:DNA-binding MarR family transcriptional regulator
VPDSGEAEGVMKKREKRVLEALKYGENLTVHELIQRTGMGPHGLATALFHLVPVGLVRRAGDHVWITKAGREELADIQPWWAGLLCRGCGGLKFGPRHLAYRLAGWCDGNGSLV